MQSLSNKASDRTTADSHATLFGSWFSTKQSPKSIATELENTREHHYHVMSLESQYQEQDSSSTLSSEKSHYDAATSAKSSSQVQTISFQPGFFETYKKKGENCVSPSPPKADCISHQVQMEHNQSLATISYPWAGSYFSRITAAYEPNAVVYPHMVGIEPARTVLPLDYTEGIPIYVNAKQYHAILRRRQTRAKLDARNKLPKSRKPYLHESRHLHALKRARGSGGRFLNTKNMQRKKPSMQIYQKDLSLQNASEPEIQHSESNSWGASTTSDVSCIFNNDNIFHQPDLRVSISALTMGPTTHTGAHSRGISINRCARISSVT